jgi:hypothetical protein
VNSVAPCTCFPKPRDNRLPGGCPYRKGLYYSVHYGRNSPAADFSHHRLAITPSGQRHPSLDSYLHRAPSGAAADVGRSEADCGLGQRVYTVAPPVSAAKLSSNPRERSELVDLRAAAVLGVRRLWPTLITRLLVSSSHPAGRSCLGI